MATADGKNEPPTTGIFLLHLRLGGTEPPSGTIYALGGTAAQPFFGWIDLMSVINRLRRWEGPNEPVGGRPPEPQTS
jgi:hypothetical protein